MNHRPFEDWLLEDQPLTSDQERDLQAHLRTCTSCSAIAESNFALHSTHMVRPAEGFAARFQLRLIENRKAAAQPPIYRHIDLDPGRAGISLLAGQPNNPGSDTFARRVDHHRSRIFAFYANFHASIRRSGPGLFAYPA